MEAIKELLIARPDRTEVWFNSKGEYQFHEGGDFTTKKTRDQILGKEEKPKAPTKKEKEAADRLDKINSLKAEKSNLEAKGKDLSDDEEYRIEEIIEELAKLEKVK